MLNYQINKKTGREQRMDRKTLKMNYLALANFSNYKKFMERILTLAYEESVEVLLGHLESGTKVS